MNTGFLSASIAWRYLKAKKSHSAVSAISIVAVVGVAIATAAIVCVLSVFNGFRSLLNDRLDTLAPDVMITATLGKTLSNGDSLASEISKIPGVEIAIPTVTDNALVIAESREMPIKLKGVNLKEYSKITSVDSILAEDASLSRYNPKDAAVSVGVAQRLGIYSTDVPLTIFAPRREGRVNIANPMTSFLTDSLNVAGVFQAMQSEYDENTVICDIEAARGLFQYDTEATAIEIKSKEGVDPTELAKTLATKLGPAFVVKDRMQQQEMNFRMVSIEKWVTFLLLIFILIIASFNIISTLCMLILEKQLSMSILSSLGMTKKRIGRTFQWESFFVTMCGGLSGIILGLILCLIQEHFGIIKLAGNSETLVLKSYPVVVVWQDVLAAFLPVLVIGIITGWIAAAFARSRVSLKSA